MVLNLMSDQEQDAALLRLVKDRSAAKRRKILLESELSAAGMALWEIGGSLKDVRSSKWNSEPETLLREVEKAPEICGMQKIKDMLVELLELQRHLGNLNRNAVDLGID